MDGSDSPSSFCTVNVSTLEVCIGKVWREQNLYSRHDEAVPPIKFDLRGNDLPFLYVTVDSRVHSSYPVAADTYPHPVPALVVFVPTRSPEIVLIAP